MEFLPHSKVSAPKNLYPCLATITISPASDRSRRLSSSSGVSGTGEDENALKRVISGGRRKGSFGTGTTGAEDKRKSFQAMGGGDEGSGKWYWRVQAGATNSQLVLMPLSQPANPLLTVAPQPLSAAMPAHSATAAKAKSSMPGGANEREDPTDSGESLTSKFKNLFKRGDDKRVGQPAPDGEGPASASTTTATGADADQTPTNNADAISSAPSTTTTAVDDRILDQTARGQMMPSAEANRVGATNLNGNAETGWPGVIKGEKLGAVVVDLKSVDPSKVVLGGGKKGEGSWVIVPINSHFGNLVHPMLEPLGKSHHEYPKSGSIRFDFDKEWIGAKGEAELLHHYIMISLENLPKTTDSGGRGQPQNTNLRLGQGTATAGSGVAAQGQGSQPVSDSTASGQVQAGVANVDLGKQVPTGA